MVRVKKQPTRGDLSEKAQKPKSKQRSERYKKYKAYIRSKKFKEVREIVLERDGHRCQFCNRGIEDGAVLSVHHRSYEHLFEGGEVEAADCITICSSDHLALHKVKRNYSWFSMDNPRNQNHSSDSQMNPPEE